MPSEPQVRCIGMVGRILLRVKLILYWLDDMAADHAAAELKEPWDDRIKRRIWEIERTERVRTMLNPTNSCSAAL